MIPAADVRAFFDATSGERATLRFLAKHPDLLFWSFFSVGGHMNYVIREFGLGKNLRCDFVLLQSYSGGWHIEFVECEPVDDRNFNRDNTPSRSLRRAQTQIHAWQQYAHEDGASLRLQLADACKRSDILQRPRRRSEPSSFAGDYLRDPKTYLSTNYTIVIGRRTTLKEDQQFVRNSMSQHSYYAIASYDRLIDTALGWEDTLSDAKNA